ncbi:hypothetical protein BaRGS_00039087 [Batillaria attramentaria]|uniref:Uncharacterized protein n=1 Tax=Batillaria attramentaria TaxID=370345 RepID=A0ABD0J419_9CAEN
MVKRGNGMSKPEGVPTDTDVYRLHRKGHWPCPVKPEKKSARRECRVEAKDQCVNRVHCFKTNLRTSFCIKQLEDYFRY